MDLTEKLKEWGTTHAAARAAERAADQGQGAPREALAREARRLREQADRLHREVYGALGNGRDRAKA